MFSKLESEKTPGRVSKKDICRNGEGIGDRKKG